MDATNAAPQFRQIADTMRRRILNGEYRTGEVLPSAAKLEELFSVSNITIRKALQLLSEEGRVRRQRGVGTIVTDTAQEPQVRITLSNNFAEWVDTAGGSNLPITQDLLDITVGKGPTRAAEHLGLGPDSPLWIMRRIRRIHGDAVSYHVNYADPAVFASVGTAAMAGRRNFVDLMREDCGLHLRRMEQGVEAIVADRDLADLLETDFGAPMFFVENVYSDDKDRVIAVTHLFLLAKYYKYKTTIEPVD